MSVSIPDWTAEGVLPPVDAGSPTSPNRSPYHVSLRDLVEHFGTTNERIRILDGFFRYRSGLHEAGLTQGFQWLNGSYMEHVEQLEQRPPNDMDVVSFIAFPEMKSQQQILSDFNEVIGILPEAKLSIKNDFHVDAYFVPMNFIAPEKLVERASYWYSMWSHRRNDSWKGFLQVSLSPDQAAKACLDEIKDREGYK